jgi:DNA-binding NarL/FixJ family response regulator
MYQHIRIIIADDHELLRSGFRDLLKNRDYIEVVGEADNGKELVEKVREFEPDVVITDIMMPIMNGIEATAEIKKEYPFIGILALSTYNDDHLIINMLHAGARGYLLKNTTGEKLAEAITSIYNGSTYFCSSTSEKFRKIVAESGINPQHKIVKPVFTPKELQIMEYICKEYSNKKISEMMNLSVRTVESYRERIFEKTGASTVAVIAIYAIKNGHYKL